MTNERLNEIGGIILDAAITVHRELGPGLLESAYQLALKRELELRGLKVRAKFSVIKNINAEKKKTGDVAKKIHVFLNSAQTLFLLFFAIKNQLREKGNRRCRRENTHISKLCANSVSPFLCEKKST